jgi:hypothetical protein
MGGKSYPGLAIFQFNEAKDSHKRKKHLENKWKM